jgi:hypothetical protein
MQVQEQKQQPDQTPTSGKKHGMWFWLRTAAFVVMLLFIAIAAFFFLQNSEGSSSTFWGAMFGVPAIILAIIQVIPIFFPSQSAPTTVINHIYHPTPPSPPPNPQPTNAAPPPTPVLVTPTSATPPISGTNFYYNHPLPNAGEFYGRKRETITLLNRTRNGASTSIVGPRRIGKTWLVSYMKMIASQELGPDFRAAYLDATDPSSQTLSGLLKEALKEWGIPNRRAEPDLLDLEDIVRSLKATRHIPILCIDEFEGLSKLQGFNLTMLENLRAIAQEGLCLIIVSRQPLIDTIAAMLGEQSKTSPFFNIFEQLTLKPFNQFEAEEFVNAKSQQAAFTDAEREKLLKYGQVHAKGQQAQWPPLRLQLVGKMLLEDKNLAASGNPHFYRPGEQEYWREFEQRLEETYRGVVR